MKKNGFEVVMRYYSSDGFPVLEVQGCETVLLANNGTRKVMALGDYELVTLASALLNAICQRQLGIFGERNPQIETMVNMDVWLRNEEERIQKAIREDMQTVNIIQESYDGIRPIPAG